MPAIRESVRDEMTATKEKENMASSQRAQQGVVVW